MNNGNSPVITITGIGIISAIGQGKDEFKNALFDGKNYFDIMQRPGRQNGTEFIGAEAHSFTPVDRLSQNKSHTISLSGQMALAALDEAWHDAELEKMNHHRIGLIIGGSNIQQRELVITQEKYRNKLHFLRPSYGLSFLDTDLCGLCTSAFNIQGMAYTVGGASASGQLAIIEAAEAVKSGRVDACIALGAMMDISYWECQSLSTLGAMGSRKYALSPHLACRPFDTHHDGFIYGEACAALVIEHRDQCRKSLPYANLTGWALHMDANRHPDPSVYGESNVINSALNKANLIAEQIDYINPHGSSSIIGDNTELQALRTCRLVHAAINATKSITGHSLTAAGAVEVAATLLQMKHKRLHPTRNLDEPIDPEFNWIIDQVKRADIQHSLCLSIGFGGVNTALCLSQI
uniref:BryQ n=1 Tax=Candidatus Endobugula sertula TaxID=62101 RepID=A2CLL8_9GAMM|nr:BryQ [Candidatus Endobugula sertula]